MAFYSFNRMRMHNGQKFFNIICWMYIFIYTIVPALVHFYVYSNGNSDRIYAALDYTTSGIFTFYINLLMAVIGFGCLNIGYKAYLEKCSISYLDDIELKESNHSFYIWFVAATFALVIGAFSQVLWTRAFGGIVGIINYASALRSGWDIGISNSYTTFKRFVPLVQFANIVYFALWARTRKISCFIFSCISLVLSIFYLLANDGRAPMAMHFVALVYIFIRMRRANKASHSFPVFKILLLGIIGIFFAHNGAEINSYFTSGRSTPLNLSFDILSSVREEFVL